MGSERPLGRWTGPLERCGIWQRSCNCSPETKKSQHHQNEHFWEGFTRDSWAHERREREAGENIYSFCVNNIYICEKIDLVVVLMSFIALLLNCHILPLSNLCPSKLFSFVYWKTWKSKAQAVHPPRASVEAFFWHEVQRLLFFSPVESWVCRVIHHNGKSRSPLQCWVSRSAWVRGRRGFGSAVWGKCVCNRHIDCSHAAIFSEVILIDIPL